MWETYKRSRKRTTGELGVTFGKNGIIGLNAAICRTLKVDGKNAQLLFDREKSLMGIKLVGQKTGDTYSLKTDARGSHASLSGTAFLKTYKIYPEKTIAFPATYDESNKVIIVDVADLLAGGKAKGKV